MTPDQIKSNWALFMECRHGKDLQNAPLPEAVLIFAEQISKLSSAMERESLYAIVKNEMIDRLEAAEKERDALRAKVDAMERQEPVGEIVAFGESLHEPSWKRGKLPHLGTKLYALPGAKGEEK